MKQNFKKYLLLIVGVSLAIAFSCGLTSCGGGGGGSTPVTPVTTDDSIDESNGLPPDPGEAGNVTRKGIDFNTNKVRDDMEIPIYKRYPRDELKRDALMRGAFVLQEAMLSGGANLDGNGGLDESFRIAEKTNLLTECLIKRFGYNSYKELGFLEALLTNTNDRGRAYDKFNAVVAGISNLPNIDTPCQDINL